MIHTFEAKRYNKIDLATFNDILKYCDTRKELTLKAEFKSLQINKNSVISDFSIMWEIPARALKLNVFCNLLLSS